MTPEQMMLTTIWARQLGVRRLERGWVLARMLYMAIPDDVAQYAEGNSLVDMIKEDLIAERIAIESYMEMIRFFGENDPTSRRLMEEVLAQEEEHADDMATLLETFDPRESSSGSGTRH